MLVNYLREAGIISDVVREKKKKEKERDVMAFMIFVLSVSKYKSAPTYLIWAAGQNKDNWKQQQGRFLCPLVV